MKDFSKIEDVEIEWSGHCVDSMVDSYIAAAVWPDGSPLTDSELDELRDKHRELHNDIVMQMFMEG